MFRAIAVVHGLRILYPYKISLMSEKIAHMKVYLLLPTQWK